MNITSHLGTAFFQLLSYALGDSSPAKTYSAAQAARQDLTPRTRRTGQHANAASTVPRNATDLLCSPRRSSTGFHGIPVPADAIDEDAQLALAIARSQAQPVRPSFEPRGHVRAAQDTPLFTQMTLGTAPGDGNCFFHSLIQLAAPALSPALGVPAGAITPQDIRRRVASRTIDQLVDYLEGGPRAQALERRHPHLVHISTMEQPPEQTLDLSQPLHLQAFVQVLGDYNAARCMHLTPTQQTHIFNIACDGSWDAGTGDIMPAAMVAAFPGLRLSVVTPEVTERTLGEHTFGEGTAAPHVLFLRDAHYVPAFPQH